jgi:hypothetical protein
MFIKNQHCQKNEKVQVFVIFKYQQKFKEMKQCRADFMSFLKTDIKSEKNDKKKSIA